MSLTSRLIDLVKLICVLINHFKLFFNRPNHVSSSSGMVKAKSKFSRDSRDLAWKPLDFQFGWVSYHESRKRLCALINSAYVHTGNSLHGTLWDYFQLESWTFEELSRRETLRVASLHMCGLFCLDGKCFAFGLWHLLINLGDLQTVDNRGQDDEGSGGGNTLQRQNSKGEAKEGDTGALQATPIEKLIHTKWAESKITFHHAVEPSKLNL